MSGGLSTFAAIVMAIIGLATVALLVSSQANTVNVISAGSSGLGTVLGAALSPVTGTNNVGTGGLLSNSSGIWT